MTKQDKKRTDQINEEEQDLLGRTISSPEAVGIQSDSDLRASKIHGARLRGLYYFARFMLGGLVAVFSVIIATNISGGSFYTLHKFTLGAFSFPAPAIIVLFSFAAAGYLLAYSEAVSKKVKRWRYQFKQFILHVEDYITRRKDSFGYIDYIRLIIKHSVQKFRDLFTQSGFLAKLERFEDRVEQTENKLWRQCQSNEENKKRREVFRKKREENRMKRFVLRYIDDWIRTEVFKKKKELHPNNEENQNTVNQESDKDKIIKQLFKNKLAEQAKALAARDCINASEKKLIDSKYISFEGGQTFVKDNVKEMFDKVFDYVIALPEFKENFQTEKFDKFFSELEMLRDKRAQQFRSRSKPLEKVNYNFFINLYDFLKAELKASDLTTLNASLMKKIVEECRSYMTRELFKRQKDKHLKSLTTVSDNIVAEAVRQLGKLPEVYTLSTLTHSKQQEDYVWQQMQLLPRNINLQIRELSKASDQMAYQCYLKVYKHIKSKLLQGNISEEQELQIKEQAVAIFRAIRVKYFNYMSDISTHLIQPEAEKIAQGEKESLTAVEQSKRERIKSYSKEDVVQAEQEIDKKMLRKEINKELQRYYSKNIFELIKIDKEDEELINIIADFKAKGYVVLFEQMKDYENKQVQQDIECFSRLVQLNILHSKETLHKRYLTRRKRYRGYLRGKAIRYEHESLAESSTYNLAPKRCMRFAAMNREQYARLDAKRYPGFWSKILYRLGIVLGLVNALANGFLGFLGILSLSTKLFGFPLVIVNVCVACGAVCAIIASWCLTFPRILRVFRELGLALDTRGVVNTSNRSEKIWSSIFALSAGLVAGSFVCLSLLVTVYFIVSQTSWIFLTMTPVLLFSSLLFSLVALVGAASLYRPELSHLKKRFFTPIKNKWYDLKDPLARSPGLFEKLFKTIVLSICVTAFLTAAVTARVALPHAIQFFAMFFNVHQVAPFLLWPVLVCGMVCLSIAVGGFVTTKQWKLVGRGLGRWLDNKIRGDDNTRYHYVLGYQFDFGKPPKGTWSWIKRETMSEEHSTDKQHTMVDVMARSEEQSHKRVRRKCPDSPHRTTSFIELPNKNGLVCPQPKRLTERQLFPQPKKLQPKRLTERQLFPQPNGLQPKTSGVQQLQLSLPSNGNVVAYKGHP